MKRPDVLSAAEDAVMGPRENSYGSPQANFDTIAKYWSLVFGVDVTAPQVAAAMICLKLARLETTPTHDDSWVDIAGYAACGSEVAE